MNADHDSYDYLIADNQEQITSVLLMEKAVLDPPDYTPPVALDMEDDDHRRLIGELIGQILGPGNNLLINLLQI